MVTVKRVIVLVIPAFEIGLWNAWILILPMVIISCFGSRILGKRGPAEVSTLTKKMKTTGNLYFALTLLLYAYSIFLPLRLGTIWLVIGLLIYLPFILFLIAGVLNFASTPVDEPATRGVYSISRNPMYLGEILVNMGIGIGCLSWIFILAATVNFLLLRYYVAVVEEPFLAEKYGDAYRKYTNRTPRWIGMPKSEKKLN